jgi:hypothetical protein
MTVHYMPRHIKDDDNRRRHEAMARSLKLEVVGDSVPSGCRVLIQHERFTADFRDTRLRPFVLYSRCKRGSRTYRASFKTLDAAATSAHKLAAFLDNLNTAN